MRQVNLQPGKLLDYLQKRLPFYIDLLRQMVEINSFTANPAGVNQLGDLTAELFGELGFFAEFVQSVNSSYGRHLFLRRLADSDNPSSPTDKNPWVAMVSHLDTVFPPEEEIANDFRFRLDGDKIYGPGSEDIKGGTVMAFMVLDALLNFYPQEYRQLNWIFCLDASEESMSDDFGKFCKARIPNDALACLIFEGGTPNQNGFPIVTARKGRAEFHISVEGRGAHAGNYHKQGANAIVQLANTIGKIAAFTDYAQQLTFNVGVVNGGSVVNRVPHHAEALVEMRAFKTEIFEAGFRKMMALNGSTNVSSLDGFPCRVTIEPKSQSAPWPRNPATDSLFDIWCKTAEKTGTTAIPEERGGLSDGNLLWQHVPVLDGLGPSGLNAHCSERSEDGSKEQEFALLSSFVPKAMLNIAAILMLTEKTE
jgi:glutamate carboxypeptidase